MLSPVVFIESYEEIIITNGTFSLQKLTSGTIEYNNSI